MGTERRYHIIDRQKVSLTAIERPGWILDLGGGGEGVIGHLCGERVVSIDLQRRKLEEMHNSALKIVMDAQDLQFLDNTFETATAFFFFTYTSPQNRAVIFKEAYRVLRPGGSLLIWDQQIPPYPGGEQDVYVLLLTIAMPDGREIQAGYGCPWPDHAQSAEDYVRWAAQAGFTVKNCQASGALFQMELVK